MSSVNDGGKGRKAGDVQKPDPNNAAVDPNAAARQDQIKADHDALQESARRVKSSVPSDVRETPVQPAERGLGSSSNTAGRGNPERAATDPRAAATQEQTKANHDRLQESARRVDASVPASVRNTPIQHSDTSTRATTGNRGDDVQRSNAPQVETDPRAAAKLDRVKADDDALEKSAQRVKASVPADVRNTPVQPVRSDIGTDSDSEEKRNANAARENARPSEKNPPKGGGTSHR